MSNRGGLLSVLVTAAVLCVLCFIWYLIGRDDGARKAYVRGYAAAVDSVKALPVQHEPDTLITVWRSADTTLTFMVVPVHIGRGVR